MPKNYFKMFNLGNEYNEVVRENMDAIEKREQEAEESYFDNYAEYEYQD